MDDDRDGTLGLPLLIVNGKFKNISKMSVKDLETFIPFLTKCSIYRSGALVVNGVPEWWISTIQYKFPLKKPNGLSQTGYRNHLLAIVCRCYWYHDAEFLMNFCAEIADRPEIVFFKNNGDNSTSIFYVKNNIHIMTFNNENKEYDMKKPEKIEKSVKRSLLPSVLSKPTPRVITDVYLCENCDAEFSSHSDMQKHEKECYGTTVDEDDDSEGEIEIIDHIKPVADSASDQSTFLDYFQLGPKRESENTSTTWKSKRRGFESPSKRWVSVDMCLHKNRTVEFSSYSGKKMLEHRARRDLIMKVERTIAANEQYCYTSNRNPREMKETLVDVKVTYRKDKKKFSSHQYCFNRKQRRDRCKTLRTGKENPEIVTVTKKELKKRKTF